MNSSGFNIYEKKSFYFLLEHMVAGILSSSRCSNNDQVVSQWFR